MPDEDPDGDGQKLTFNLRFPGQYFDRETNTHYNYMRDYDPSIGRYVESDAIGLRGGSNTYLYTNADPLRFIDPSGLDVRVTFYGGNVGHLGIGIVTGEGEQGTVGFYPAPGSTGNLFFGVPGAVLPDDPARGSATVVIKTTPQQDECVTRCINERTANPGIYQLTGRNCTGFVNDCLTRCRIATPGGPVGPWGYFINLQKYYRQCTTCN